MIGFSTALVCVMVSYVQADNSYFRPNSLNIRRERNICRRLCFSTDSYNLLGAFPDLREPQGISFLFPNALLFPDFLLPLLTFI